MTDATHDPARLSWVASANGHAEFPIQNLPFGVFSIAGDRPRGGVAIGDAVFDIGAALELGLFSGTARDAAEAAAGPALNPLLALPASARRALRQRLSDILSSGQRCGAAMHRACCTTPLPARCICRPTSATTRISSPASITRARAARSRAPRIR